MNESLREIIPLLIPLIVIELGLVAFSLYDLVKRKRVRGGNKILWAVIIILIGTIGPVIYLVAGREEE